MTSLDSGAAEDPATVASANSGDLVNITVTLDPDDTLTLAGYYHHEVEVEGITYMTGMPTVFATVLK